MAALTQEQLEDIFWHATVMAIGLEPDPEQELPSKRVRISWPTGDNTTWEREENVVFLRIMPSPDDFTSLKDITHSYDQQTDDLKEVIEYHRSFTIVWVCYGPDAYTDADAIRIGILREPIKAYLRKNKIGIHPHIREPVRMDELDDSGLWWRRFDTSATFYDLATREYHEGIIAHAPDTILIKNK